MVPIEHLREFQDKQVRMLFDDEHEVVATLLSVSNDMDDSVHLVYDRVMWANDPREFATAQGATVHAEGESLVSISLA